MIEIAGQSYEGIIGSDVARNGMFLEVSDAQNALIATIYFFDRDGSMNFTGHRPDIPLPLIEWMIVTAKERLVRASDNDR